MVFGRAGFCHLFCSPSTSMTYCWICISLVLAVFGISILLELFVMPMMWPCWHLPLVLLDWCLTGVISLPSPILLYLMPTRRNSFVLVVLFNAFSFLGTLWSFVPLRDILGAFLAMIFPMLQTSLIKQKIRPRKPTICSTPFHVMTGSLNPHFSWVSASHCLALLSGPLLVPN